MALVRLERFDEAADWGAKAAARPNAHAHVLGIAAYSLALAGRVDEARPTWRRSARGFQATASTTFLTAMQFAPDGVALFRQGRQARRHRMIGRCGLYATSETTPAALPQVPISPKFPGS